jgi:photosystem II stability/assembly factor-like uncharacterized protein
MMQSLRIAAVVLACCGAAPSQAGLDPLTTPAYPTARAAQALLLGVARAGERLVAVGERGIVVRSDDGGASWTQSPVPVSSTLTAVTFAGTQRGWAVGHDGVVLHSADGGRSWTRQLDGNATNAMTLAAAVEAEKRARDTHDAAALKQAAHRLDDAQAAAKFGPSRPLLAVWFRNESEGLAAGSYGVLLRTRDGGRRWELASEAIANPDGYHFNAITSTPAGTLLIAGEAGRVYRSVDGGTRWETLDTGYKGQLYGALGVRGEGGEDILAFGFKGNLFRLAAGSRTWQPLASGTTKTLVAGVLLGHGEPLLVAADGRLLAGAKQGREFKPVGSVPLPAAVAISPAPGSAAFAVSGSGGVRRIALDAQAQGARP